MTEIVCDLACRASLSQLERATAILCVEKRFKLALAAQRSSKFTGLCKRISRTGVSESLLVVVIG